MFDDQQTGTPGTPPPNLPISDKEPEDIFAGVDDGPGGAPQPMQQPGAGMPAEHASSLGAPPPAFPASEPSQFAGGLPPLPEIPLPGASTALGAGVLKPKQPENKQEETPLQSASGPLPYPAHSPAQTGAMPQDASRPSQMAGQPPHDTYKIKQPSIGRSIMIAIIVLVVVVVLGGGGWWVYRSFINSPDPDFSFEIVDEEAPTDQNTGHAPGAQTPPPPAPRQDVTPEIIDEEALFGEPVDTDGDGLDDTREAQIGTDPNNWDTDGDELSDGDEIIIWKTDPLDPDTDGDTYLDGMEVRSGYNPAGAGRIFEPPAADTNTGGAAGGDGAGTTTL